MSGSETWFGTRLLSIPALLAGLMVLFWCADATHAQNLERYDPEEGDGDRSLSEIPSHIGGAADGKSFHTQDGTNLVTNGGFEDGLEGWSTSNVNLFEGGWFEQTGNTTPFNEFTVPAPSEGTQAAMSDQEGAGLRVLYQDVFIPDGEATLEFDLYAWSQGDWAVPESETLDPQEDPNQHLRVDIVDPDAPLDDVEEGVLKNIFLTDPENDSTEFGYDRIESDLSDLSGQTVRIRFAEVDNQQYLNVGVDNVVLESDAEMGVVDVSPDAGGNEGTVTATVFGFGFEEGFEAELVHDDHSDIVGEVTDVAEDGTQMAVSFDLAGQPEGDRDLVVTDPDGESSTLRDAFAIVSGDMPELWTHIQGRDELQGEESTTITIHYGNQGDADLHDILLYVHLPADLEFDIREDDMIIPEMEGAVSSEDFDGGDEYKDFDPYFEVDDEIVLPLWIYRLPAKSSEKLQIDITVPDPGLSSTLSERLGSAIRAEIAALPPEASEFTRTGDFESSDPGMLTHFADLILMAAREEEELSSTSVHFDGSNAITRQTGLASKSGSCSPGPQPDPDDMLENNREQVYSDIFSEVDLPSGKQWAVGLGVGFAATVACGSTPIGWGACAAIGGASGALALSDFFSVMDNYDDLENDDCNTPDGDGEYDPEMCEGDDCDGGGQTYGDPHMMTLDQMAYEFQAVGEFILTRSTTDDLEVQARMEQMEPDIEKFTILTAVAMDVAGDEVVVEEGTSQNQTPPYTPTFRVNGSEQELPEAGSEPVELPGGGTVSRIEQTLIIEWPDSRARADIWQNASNLVTGNRALGIELLLSDQYRGNVEGLLGTMDGNTETDFTTRDGTVLQRPLSFDELYRDFGDSWRISQDESLFGTETFADLSIPSEQLTVDDLDPNDAQEAKEICEAAGVDDPVLLNNCIFDISLSGDTSFADDATRLTAPRAKEQVDDWLDENESKLQVDLDVPAAFGQAFPFSVEGVEEFTLSDDGDGSTLTHTEAFHPLAPGTYEVSQEELTEGWALESITCRPDENASTDVDERKAILEIEAGEAARCTFEVVPTEMELDLARGFADPTDDRSYQLVSLPGQVDVGLEATLSGDPGPDWRAFRETGVEEEALEEYDGSEAFRFRPGRGFWVLAQEEWTFEETIDPIEAVEGTLAIDLHEGWNVISNPLTHDIDWTVVADKNDLDELLWRWDGSWQEADTFETARRGEAYYVFNDDPNREQLNLSLGPDEEEKILTKTEDEAGEEAVFVLDAQVDGERVSGVTVGLAANEEQTSAHRAPPSHFETASLRVIDDKDTGGDDATEYVRLVTSRSDDAGQTFELALRGEPETAVELVASDLDAFGRDEVVLVEPETGRHHDLRQASEVAVPITEEDGKVALQLLVGSDEYVKEETVPEEFVLHPPYPNPSNGQVTVEYALPNEADVTITVYNALGQRVAVLEESPQTAGNHQIQWSAGSQLSSGTYFIRLDADGQTDTEQVVIVR